MAVSNGDGGTSDDVACVEPGAGDGGAGLKHGAYTGGAVDWLSVLLGILSIGAWGVDGTAGLCKRFDGVCPALRKL